MLRRVALGVVVAGAIAFAAPARAASLAEWRASAAVDEGETYMGVEEPRSPFAASILAFVGAGSPFIGAGMGYQYAGDSQRAWDAYKFSWLSLLVPSIVNGYRASLAPYASGYAGAGQAATVGFVSAGLAYAAFVTFVMIDAYQLTERLNVARAIPHPIPKATPTPSPTWLRYDLKPAPAWTPPPAPIPGP